MAKKESRTPRKREIRGDAAYQLPSRVNENHRVEYYMTPELEAVFKKLYPMKSNREMMQLFGVCNSLLDRFRKKLGLRKDPRIVKERSARNLKAACERSGYYDKLRREGPGKACHDAYMSKLATGWHPLYDLQKNHPYRYKKMIEKVKQHKREVMESERKRIAYGLPQLTRIHLPEDKFTARQAAYRCSMKKFGYILGDMSDNSGERFTIYYDSLTERHPVCESHASRYRFTIKELKD